MLHNAKLRAKQLGSLPAKIFLTKIAKDETLTLLTLSILNPLTNIAIGSAVFIGLQNARLIPKSANFNLLAVVAAGVGTTMFFLIFSNLMEKVTGSKEVCQTSQNIITACPTAALVLTGFVVGSVESCLNKKITETQQRHQSNIEITNIIT